MIFISREMDEVTQGECVPVVGPRREPCGIPDKLWRPGRGGAASHETEKAARAVGGQQESKESMTCVLTER